MGQTEEKKKAMKAQQGEKVTGGDDEGRQVFKKYLENRNKHRETSMDGCASRGRESRGRDRGKSPWTESGDERHDSRGDSPEKRRKEGTFAQALQPPSGR